MSSATRMYATAGLALGACAGLAHGQGSFYEPFDTGIVPANWVIHNQSNPVGGTQWNVQADSPVFPAAHTPPAIISANYNNTGDTGTISDWLLTPQATLRNGDTLSFYTRSASGSEGGNYADRMQIRMSTAGASTNTGTTEFAVGDFTTLMLDINPTYVPAGYPHGVWQNYTLTVGGLGGPTGGRFAFRYFVEGGGFSGANSNYIGVDTVSYTSAAATPGACCLVDGSCSLQNPVACYNNAGSYAGDGVSCAAANCPQPGACCQPDGTCQLLGPAQCAAIDGAVFRGNGVACPSTCATTGACCLLDGTCALQNESACKSNNGLFRGLGASCSGASCPSSYPYLGQPVTIDDAVGTVCGAQVFAEINVTDSFTIAGADVSMFATHTYQGDLQFWLKHVSTGTTVRIVNQPSAGSGTYGADNFGNSSAPGGLMRLVDSAPDFYRTPPVPATGIDGVHWQWKPESPLSAFAGQNSAGTWQLIAQDCGPGDIGNIESWVLSLHHTGAVVCYPNCDHSTAVPFLNVQDFSCFLTKYAAADPYANCDNSTQPPILNVQDFSCFLTKYAAGCSAP